jgi:hypothetical protein
MGTRANIRIIHARTRTYDDTSKTDTCTCTYDDTHIHTYIHMLQTRRQARAHLHSQMQFLLQVSSHSDMVEDKSSQNPFAKPPREYVFVCLCQYIYVCVCVCIYIYIYCVPSVADFKRNPVQTVDICTTTRTKLLGSQCRARLFRISKLKLGMRKAHVSADMQPLCEASFDCLCASVVCIELVTDKHTVRMRRRGTCWAGAIRPELQHACACSRVRPGQLRWHEQWGRG